ncbi:hypothetical protein PGH42_18380 [Legionella pneumophila]|nr:hypothetical protein PGH42_18380 [Legionella pneumophila]
MLSLLLHWQSQSAISRRLISVKKQEKEINLLKNLPGLYETTPDFTEEFNNQRMPSLQRA